LAGELESFDQVPDKQVDRLLAWYITHNPAQARDGMITSLASMYNIPAERGARLADEALGRARRWSQDQVKELSDAVDGWEPPVPLSAVPDPPAFPAGVFPGWIEAQVSALAEFAQVPRDLPAMVILGVLAAAAGGHAVIGVRPGWSEPLNLYVVPAMASGARKSPVYAPLVAPLLTAEKMLAEASGDSITEARTTRAIADKASRAAEKRAADAIAEVARTDADPQATAEDKQKAGDARKAAEEDARAKATLAEAVEVPVVPRLLVDDVTPEKMTAMMAEQGGRLAIVSDEGGPLISLAGRYSTSKEPDLEAWLKGHNGLHAEIRVDRLGRPPDYVRSPALTVCLTVQPGVLRRLHKIPQLRDRGLLARILYSMPPDYVGSRRVRTREVPYQATVDYDLRMTGVVAGLAAWTEPLPLQMAPGALEMLLAFAEALEPRLLLEGDLGHLRDWASKLTGAVARIAGLLHVAGYEGDAHKYPVGEETMARALAVGEYLIAHAIAAFDYMGADPQLEDARAVLAWLRRTGKVSFIQRDLYRAMQTRFRKAEDTEPALTALDGNGWIREAKQERSAGRGRPASPAFDVHPALFRPPRQK
jgi:hypothetical protein